MDNHSNRSWDQKKRSVFEGLMGKLDSELSAEKIGLNLTRSSTSTPSPLTSPPNFLGQHAKPHLTNPQIKPKLDPLSMLPKVRKARQRRVAMNKARHNRIMKQDPSFKYSKDLEEVIDIDDGSNNDLKDIDESKFKTMDWIEPDGSKTKLRFDEDGTLIGKAKK